MQVAALVESPDGELSVQRARASSRRRGQDLARRWQADGRVVAAAVVQRVHALEVDARRSEQWGMTELAAEQVQGAVGPASSQVVAVLDTGVDVSHPDLAGVLVPGKDLVDRGPGMSDPSGHGTHIAGVIGAVGGNGIGVAGLAQGARVMPVRVLDASGWGSDAAVAEGVLWAVEHGASVLNLSLAGETPSALLSTAIQHALQRGVVVVAGSGNSGEKGDPVLHPAAEPGVIAVGAVDRSGARPAWSSTGPHLAVVAPGASIMSTVPGGGYAAWSGTSMASPFVAAAAALVKHAEPRLTPAQVRSRLMDTARDLGPAGFDVQHGAGRLDVAAAHTAGRPVAPVAAAVRAAQSAPVLSLRGSRSASVVKKGTNVTFTGRAVIGTAGTAGVTMVLERRVGGGAWTVLRRGTSGSGGLLSFSLAPDRTAEHRFHSGSVVSPSLRVDVRAR